MRTFFVWLIILIAIILAILGITLPRNHLPIIIIITNFFDIMIPVLAVGALVNYLWKSCTCCRKEHHHE